MSLPIFDPTQDPGPNFSALLDRLGLKVDLGKSLEQVPYDLVPHGTTVLAIKYSDGVLMAGDRRATEANRIAHRLMEKVFPADSHSGVAIAGAAGPAVELVKMFQTQLAHFEKVEGLSLTLEGKANQLGQLVKAHFEMAMIGMVVIPLFAGFDLDISTGRIFSYDVTGGYYEEANYQATGSGGRDAKGVIKQGFKANMNEDEVIELAVRALFDAADEDSATGGPDPIRNIYPIVSVITKDGYREIDQERVKQSFDLIMQSRENL